MRREYEARRTELAREGRFEHGRLCGATRPPQAILETGGLAAFATERSCYLVLVTAGNLTQLGQSQ
jgi:hypothetical protein